jgi:hypothetical protein
LTTPRFRGCFKTGGPEIAAIPDFSGQARKPSKHTRFLFGKDFRLFDNDRFGFYSWRAGLPGLLFRNRFGCGGFPDGGTRFPSRPSPRLRRLGGFGGGASAPSGSFYFPCLFFRLGDLFQFA